MWQSPNCHHSTDSNASHTYFAWVSYTHFTNRSWIVRLNGMDTTSAFNKSGRVSTTPSSIKDTRIGRLHHAVLESYQATNVVAPDHSISVANGDQYVFDVENPVTLSSYLVMQLPCPRLCSILHRGYNQERLDFLEKPTIGEIMIHQHWSKPLVRK